MPSTVDASKIEWHKASRFDPQGRLFWKDGRLFRAMWNYDAAYYQSLLDTIYQNAILSENVVRTTQTDFRISGARGVLEHEIIWPFLPPLLWSSRMFRDAGLCHVETHIELARRGYTLQDAHPWNIAFRFASPKLIDLGSIVRRDDMGLRRGLVDEYKKYVLLPLLLMSKGQASKARRYLTCSEPALCGRDLLGYISFRDACAIIAARLSWRRLLQKDLPSLLGAIRDSIGSMSLPSHSSRFKGYHDREFGGSSEAWHAKQRHVRRVMNELRSASTLDIGCATGWYSVLAAEMGNRVIAVDVDEEMVNSVYDLARRRDLPITPCLTDACSTPFSEMLVSDVVFAMAIIHHLVFTQRYDFEQIVSVLATYARKCLITEFMGPEDPFVRQHMEDGFSFYSLDNFIHELERRFSKVTTFPSTSNNRTLLVCEK
jgi:SAM-dependent methyltransferase